MTHWTSFHTHFLRQYVYIVLVRTHKYLEKFLQHDHVYNSFIISQNISGSTGAKGEVKSSFYYSLILFTNILVIKTNLLEFFNNHNLNVLFYFFFIKERGSRTSRPSKIKLYILIIYFISVLPANNWVINLQIECTFFILFLPAWKNWRYGKAWTGQFVKNINNSKNFWPFFQSSSWKNEQPALQNVHLTAW